MWNSKAHWVSEHQGPVGIPKDPVSLGQFPPSINLFSHLCPPKDRMTGWIYFHCQLIFRIVFFTFHWFWGEKCPFEHREITLCPHHILKMVPLVTQNDTQEGNCPQEKGGWFAIENIVLWIRVHLPYCARYAFSSYSFIFIITFPYIFLHSLFHIESWGLFIRCYLHFTGEKTGVQKG